MDYRNTQSMIMIEFFQHHWYNISQIDHCIVLMYEIFCERK